MIYKQTLELKSITEDGTIEGYASVFNTLDENGDIVESGAFSNAIAQFQRGKAPKLLWQHDVNQPIGIIENLEEDDYGLRVKAKLMLDIPKAKEVYFLLKNQAIDGFSIGYRVREHHRENGNNHLTDIDLLEISIVTFPACPDAKINNVKSIEKQYIERKNNMLNLPLSETNEGNFSEFIRKGVDSFLTKSLNSGSDKDGAVFLPANIVTKIENKLKYLSPMRSLAKITKISTNYIDLIVDSKLPDAGWSAANDEERLETDSPEVKKIKIIAHELYAKPKANQILLADAQVDVEDWLVSKISEKFAILEDNAFINGTGEDKPHGFLKYQSSNLEIREFGTLQHFCSGGNGAFADNETALNVLIDMVASLKTEYIKNAKWIMSRSAFAAIRKIKNRDGTNIWQPSLSEFTPSSLLGYPVIIDDNMPKLEAGTESISVALGDFLAGYQIVDRQGLSILRDPYTSKPFVEFYASKRVGGDVVDFDAIKLLKFSEN